MARTIDYWIEEESMGATATTFRDTVDTINPITEVLIGMTFLQDGATLCDLSDVLTQIGSEINIRHGSDLIVSGSPTDLYHILQNVYMGGVGAHLSDGTGADNHVMSVVLPIPLGHVVGRTVPKGDFGVDPASGKKITVEIKYPADANEIDGRVLNIGLKGYDDLSPNKVIRRVTRNKTPTATGDFGTIIDLPYGDGIKLYDMAFFQTTALTAGTTSNTQTIEKIRLELNTKEANIGGAVSELFTLQPHALSATTTSPIEPSTYLYHALCEFDSVDAAIPLDKKARWNIHAGDTNALRDLSATIESLN